MHQYEIKVRAEGTYIWGGPHIVQNTSSNLILVVQVDEVGTAIDLETDNKDGAQTLYGTLDPEQLFAIPLFGLRSVKATSSVDRDSIVSCVLYCPLAAQGIAAPAAAKPGGRAQQSQQPKRKK